MESYFLLRISLKHTTQVQVQALLERYATTSAQCTEDILSENPHMHIYLSTLSKQQALRTAIRKLTNSSQGNTLYSLKECDQYPIPGLAYMLKGNDYNLTDLPLDIQVQAQEYNDKVVSEMKKKKEGRKTLLQQIDETLQPILEERPTNLPSAITHHVISYYRHSKSLVREFQLVSITQSLLLKYDPSYPQVLALKILEKII